MYGGGELLILRLRPYVHFLGPALPHAASGPTWIGREPVVGHGIIHNSGQLIVDGLEICLGKRVPGFIPIGYQFVLPFSDLDGVNIAYF